ncbi:unnamed protein product [Didymodactylos carnosus]|uniref:Uncharacterized protein n=1 Tax=Didymodactylos carnosus TaxID=1234261 RepID=A0A8S2ET39_9BILA|nr:unnamed protein product [Didymodactylos carnosus]CAF4059987.1 unnamed protein product [Didymodactylos carnosus]
MQELQLHTYRQVKEINLFSSSSTEAANLKEYWARHGHLKVSVFNMDKLEFELSHRNLEYCVNKLANDPTNNCHKQMGILANELERAIESFKIDNEGQQETRQNHTNDEEQQECSEDETNNEGQPK